jgi:hypothetical protein
MDGRSAHSHIVPGVTGLPIQFVARAVAFIVGLTLLLIVDVRGVMFYLAWSLVVLAFLSEVVATFVYWLRGRSGSPVERRSRRRPGA